MQKFVNRPEQVLQVTVFQLEVLGLQEQSLMPEKRSFHFELFPNPGKPETTNCMRRISVSEIYKLKKSLEAGGD